jgi:hypothetical protein
MRRDFVFPALVIAMISSGCSGAEPQDVLQGSPSSGGSTTSSGGTTSGGTTSGGTPPGEEPADAGPPRPACEDEREPNDDPKSANRLKTSVCGEISNARDVDYLTFELDGDTTTMSLRFEGRVTLKVTVAGHAPVVLSEGGSQELPFVRDEPYLIEIRPSVRAFPVPWRVDLIQH